MVTYTYDMALVLAAVLVSFMAAFTGLTLTNGISNLPVGTRKTLVVMSAFVLGGGIWSMHFVAMLAMEFPVPIFYDRQLTLASAWVAILLAGLALLLMHFRPRTRSNMIVAGVVLGAGIISMHFLGMNGIRGCVPVYGAFGVAVSALVAATMGVAAVWTAYGKRTKQNIFFGALVFGMSVVVV
ncbi:MAG: carbon monoxide dehydrogenase, partial [Hyphomicrobiales bacterium]|nr:carbon monoxide dehydrogenase [Hyphomicrobiales bacterium]